MKEKTNEANLILSNINSSAQQETVYFHFLSGRSHYTDSWDPALPQILQALRHAGGVGCLGGAIWGQGL